MMDLPDKHTALSICGKVSCGDSISFAVFPTHSRLTARSGLLNTIMIVVIQGTEYIKSRRQRSKTESGEPVENSNRRLLLRVTPL